MSEEDAFLKAISQNPYDESSLLVYADWLEEKGDVRAEYLRVFHQVRTGPQRMEDLARQIDPKWIATITGGRGKRPRLRISRSALNAYPFGHGDPQALELLVQFKRRFPNRKDLAEIERSIRCAESVRWQSHELANLSNNLFLQRRAVEEQQANATRQEDLQAKWLEILEAERKVNEQKIKLTESMDKQTITAARYHLHQIVAELRDCGLLKVS